MSRVAEILREELRTQRNAVRYLESRRQKVAQQLAELEAELTAAQEELSVLEADLDALPEKLRERLGELPERQEVKR